MKIFSWVHRHFHHKKTDYNNDDKVALLLEENEANFTITSGCDDDIWTEGILAIGTLGVGLFPDKELEKDGSGTKNNEEVLFFGDHAVDDEEMESPLVPNASNYEHAGFVHVEKVQDLLPPLIGDDDVAKPENGQQDYGGTINDSTKMKKHGERTTLADLLRADSEKIDSSQGNGLCDDDDHHHQKMKVVPCYNRDNKGNTSNRESIKSLLILKNKTKLVKDDSAQPMIKQTKRLIKKMLKKKKIHPADISSTGINNQKKTSTQETDHVIHT